MARKSQPDQRVDRQAARRHGVITMADALSCGLTREQIRNRVGSGRWLHLAPGVYRAAGAPVTWQQAALAACLAAPAGAVASHLTAVALWGLGPAPALPNITVPPSASARTRIARVHRSTLVSRDRTVIGPTPVTTVARTLVDVAALLADARLADVVDEALVRELASPETVRLAAARAARRPGRAGTARLDRVLEAWTPGIVAGSSAEMRLLRRLAEWRLPTPVRQYPVRSPTGELIGRVDLAWPGPKVGLEYDSVRWHGPRQWGKDEPRHAAIEAAGFTLLHADRLDLRPGFDDLRIRLADALAARAA